MGHRLVEKAVARAQSAHACVVRRCTGEPFFNHPERVANMVRVGASPAMLAAAYLHDVVEDTNFSIDDFPPRVRQLVDLLTRRPGEEKVDAIKRIGEAMDADAALIKVADRIDNLRDGAKCFGEEWLEKYLDGAEVIVSVAQNCLALHPSKTHQLVLQLDALIEELRPVK